MHIFKLPKLDVPKWTCAELDLPHILVMDKSITAVNTAALTITID